MVHILLRDYIGITCFWELSSFSFIFQFYDDTVFGPEFDICVIPVSPVLKEHWEKEAEEAGKDFCEKASPAAVPGIIRPTTYNKASGHLSC